MNRILLLSAIALFSSMNAQTGFKLGANVGLPAGDISDVSSVSFGVDAAYLFPVSADFNVGVASGYNFWVGKDLDVPGFGTVEVSNFNTVPIALQGQYRFTPEFSLSADLGYAFLFANGDNTGGFYYAPKAAYHFGPSEINLSYRGITKDGSTVGSVNLGYAYSFGK